MASASRHVPRKQADHVYGRLAELARRRHRKPGKTAAAASIALLANLRASSLGERRPSDHEMSTWDKVDRAPFIPGPTQVTVVMFRGAYGQMVHGPGVFSGIPTNWTRKF